MRNRSRIFLIIMLLYFIVIIGHSVFTQEVELPDASYEIEESEEAPGWIIDIMDKGGPVMYPLFLCSVLGLAITFERSIKLRRTRIFPANFIVQMRTFLRKKDIPRVLALCESRKSPVSRIIRMGLLKYKDGLKEVERAIEGAASLEVAILGERLRILSTMATLSPMLGFLGTVTGMIKAFNIIAATGSGRPDLIAGGISEALVTTATGLMVGIPLSLAYHYFQGKVDGIIIELEEISLGLLEELGR